MSDNWKTRIVDGPAKELLELLARLGMFVALMGTLMGLPLFLLYVSKHPEVFFGDGRKGCVTIQEAGERVFSVDSCENTVHELPPINSKMSDFSSEEEAK